MDAEAKLAHITNFVKAMRESMKESDKDNASDTNAHHFAAGYDAALRQVQQALEG
jgi:hypothetical protein